MDDYLYSIAEQNQFAYLLLITDISYFKGNSRTIVTPFHLSNKASKWELKNKQAHDRIIFFFKIIVFGLDIDFKPILKCLSLRRWKCFHWVPLYCTWNFMGFIFICMLCYSMHFLKAFVWVVVLFTFSIDSSVYIKSLINTSLSVKRTYLHNVW